MGTIILMPQRSKTPKHEVPSLRNLVLASLEDHRAKYGPGLSQWKLKKKDPDQRAFLIRLARNLGEILEDLPPGSRGKALEAARGARTQETGDANKYVTRVAIPIERTGTPDELVRRLTPYVARYIAVAMRVGEITLQGKDHYLGTLFRDTPLDTLTTITAPTIETIWAQDFASILENACTAISRRHCLATLFDQLYAANLEASDNGQSPEYNMTAWLSETFGEGASGWSDVLNAGFSRECTEPGTPWSGLAFFVPRVLLLTESYDLALGPARPETTEGAVDARTLEGARESHAKLHLQLETWLAIEPEVDEPLEPCRTRGTFLLRPAITFETDHGVRSVRQIAATKDHIRIAVHPEDPRSDEDEIWRTLRTGARHFSHRPEEFMRWFYETANTNYSSIGGNDDPAYCWRAILDPGIWWLLPLDANNVERVLGDADDSGSVQLAFHQPYGIPDNSALEDFYSLDCPVIQNLVPRLAPVGTAANALQLNLMAFGQESPVISTLEAEAIRIQNTFDRTKSRVREAVDARFTRILADLNARKGDSPL